MTRACSNSTILQERQTIGATFVSISTSKARTLQAERGTH